MPQVLAEGGGRRAEERMDKDRWPLLETLLKLALEFGNHLKIDTRRIFAPRVEKPTGYFTSLTSRCGLADLAIVGYLDANTQPNARRDVVEAKYIKV